MNKLRILGMGLCGAILCALIPWFSAWLFLALIGVRDVHPGPFALIHYWTLYSHSNYWMQLYGAAVGPWLLVLVGALALIFSRPNTQYGNAHFATEREIRKAGLRASEGLLLGKKGGRYLCAAGQIGALIFAPPRSGKGVGFGIPNLLNWQGSAIVTDIKLENYEITSGFRRQYGQKVIVFSPLDPKGRTLRYNALDFVSRDPNQRVNDLQKITFKLLPTPEKDNPMWANEGRDLLEGFILYLMDIDPPATLGRALRLIRSIPDIPKWIETQFIEHSAMLDEHTRLAFTGFLQKSFKEQSGVLSSVKGALSLWSNPLVDRATAATDFDPGQLRKRRMTIYVGVQPGDIGRVAPLISVFLQQTFDTLLQHLPSKREPYRVLALLDEFTAMGRLANVEKGIAYFASYNICLAPIIQDLTQLHAVYGSDMEKTFLSTSRYRIAYAQNNDDTASYISRQLGTKTIRTKTRSRRTNEWTGSVSHGHAGRELLLPHDIMQLSPRDEIVLVENYPPVYGHKIVYFKDREFKKRLLPPAPLPGSTLAREHPAAVNTFIEPSTKYDTAQGLARNQENQGEANDLQFDQINEAEALAAAVNESTR